MSTYDYGMWSLVFLNSALFFLFVFAFFHPRKKREWRSLGVAAAFIVALFLPFLRRSALSSYSSCREV